MYKPGQYQYQMGYTLPEFTRSLQGGFSAETSPWRSTRLSALQWQIDHREANFKIQINLQPLEPRKIALLSLPVLQVDFKPLIDDAALEKMFFQTFFQYFHKGGG